MVSSGPSERLMAGREEGNDTAGDEQRAERSEHERSERRATDESNGNVIGWRRELCSGVRKGLGSFPCVADVVGEDDNGSAKKRTGGCGWKQATKVFSLRNRNERRDATRRAVLREAELG